MQFLLMKIRCSFVEPPTELTCVYTMTLKYQVTRYGKNERHVVFVNLNEDQFGRRSIEVRRHGQFKDQLNVTHHPLWKSTIQPWLNGKNFEHIPSNRRT